MKGLKVLFVIVFFVPILAYKINHNRKTISDYPVISEICSHNSTLVYDAFGRYKDYIKIYNPTTKKICLRGYSLSDSKKELQRFVFPDAFIEPKSFLLVFCVNIGINFFAGNYYTNFSISDNEKIYLCTPEGKIIDKVKIPKMDADYTFQRVNNAQWVVAKGIPLKSGGGYLII